MLKVGDLVRVRGVYKPITPNKVGLLVGVEKNTHPRCGSKKWDICEIFWADVQKTSKTHRFRLERVEDKNV